MTGKDSLQEQQNSEKKPFVQRVGWLIVIYSGSVVALGIAAYLMRLFMAAAGMKSH
jgi:hypothetical protein